MSSVKADVVQTCFSTCVRFYFGEKETMDAVSSKNVPDMGRSKGENIASGCVY